MFLLSTSSLKGYWIHKIFILTKKAWYDWLDLVIERNNYDSLNWDYLKTLVDVFELPIVSITAPTKWIDKKKVDHIVNIAKKVWAQSITFSPPHITDKNTSWFSSYLMKVKRDTGLSILIQNIEPKMFLFIIPEYRNNTFTEIKRVTGDTALNIWNLDKSSGIDPLKAQRILWATMKNVYFCDKAGSRTGLLPGWAWGWVSYLPLESFLMKLRTVWYHWFITLKVKPSELWAWNDERVLQNLDYAKTYYKKHFLEFKT